MPPKKKKKKKKKKKNMFRLPLLNNDLCFPSVEHAHSSGLLAAGGDLSVPRLILAYSSGIFPWFDIHDPFLWWSPDPRFILFTEKFKLSKRQERYIKKANFHITANTAFASVIRYCAQIPREKGILFKQDNGENGSDTCDNGKNDNEENGHDTCDNGKNDNDTHATWITPNMIYAYEELFQEGYAHSVEVWEECKEESLTLFHEKHNIHLEENSIYSEKNNIHLAESSILFPNTVRIGASKSSKNNMNTYNKTGCITPVFMIKGQKKYHLVGGLYGVRMGHIFCGESMFHLVPEASRAALVFLVHAMKKHNMPLLDSQQRTPHIERMGGQEISRKDYLQILQEGLDIHGTAHTSPFLS